MSKGISTSTNTESLVSFDVLFLSRKRERESGRREKGKGEERKRGQVQGKGLIGELVVYKEGAGWKLGVVGIMSRAHRRRLQNNLEASSGEGARRKIIFSFLEPTFVA